MQRLTQSLKRIDFKELIVKRIPKFLVGNLLGTVVDMLVLWFFAHCVFKNYFGQVIVSPFISFECAVYVNFLVSYHYTWKDRVNQHKRHSFFKRYMAYNVSCTGGFLIKMGALVLIEYLTKWDVVICNFLALMVSGTFNFMMNEFVIFRKKKGA